MKRISKREIEFRSDMFNSVPVVIDRFEHGHAVVKAEGMTCRLDISPSERRDLKPLARRRVWLCSWPSRQGDGMLPKGYRPEGREFWWLRGQDDRVLARLKSPGCDKDVATLRYRRYAQSHQVGELVDADVHRVYRNKIRLRLAKGVFSTLPINDYIDRMPGWTRMDLGRWPVPNRMEVILRRVDADRCVIQVTFHGYPRDPDYCNAEAGYRGRYDATEGAFRVLPWDRPPKAGRDRITP